MRALTNAGREELQALRAKFKKLGTQLIILNQAAAFFAQYSKLCSLTSIRRRSDSQCESGERPSTSRRVAIMPGPNSVVLHESKRFPRLSAGGRSRSVSLESKPIRESNRAYGAKNPRASHLASERRGPHATRWPRVSSTQGIQNARARASPPLPSPRYAMFIAER